MSTKNPELKIVEVHGQRLTTSSLVIAEQFAKRHDNIVKKIESTFGSENEEILEFTRLHFKVSEYVDSSGKSNKFYQMTEEGFVEIALTLTGDKARLVRIRFIAEFKRIRKLLNEPNRKQEIQLKRDSNGPMNNMLEFVRESLDKETEKRHYSNEAFFCNRALSNVWGSLDETTLDVYDARQLGAIRNYNTLLMTRFLKQGDRKKLMDEFVVQYRIKHPRLKLIQN